MSDSEQQSSLEWYSAGIGYDQRRRRETLVRAWLPGDGLTCVWAGYQKSHSCGAPVAVVKEVLLEKPDRHDKAVINRVVCVRHLARVFGADQIAATQEHDTDRAALETLAKRHWDEYTAILAELRGALLRDRLSALPQELRNQVVELIDSQGVSP